MNLDEVKALFMLAGFNETAFHEVRNKYWPDTPQYDVVRTPWWLVKTPFGLIEIGWRKRVISINWSDTAAKVILSKDDVTKDDHFIHAWSYAKALEYLTTLRFFLLKHQESQG